MNDKPLNGTLRNDAASTPMINGIAVDGITDMSVLQKFAKQRKIPFIGVTKPVLCAYIKKSIREKQDVGVPVEPVVPEVKEQGTIMERLMSITENETTGEVKKTKPKKKVAKPKASKPKKPAKKAAVKKAVPPKKATAPKQPTVSTRKKREYTPALTIDDIKKLRDEPTVKAILKLDIKKHQQMYVMYEAGYRMKQIAAVLTDGQQGHVWNELERYKEDKERRDEVADHVKKFAKK